MKNVLDLTKIELNEIVKLFETDYFDLIGLRDCGIYYRYENGDTGFVDLGDTKVLSYLYENNYDIKELLKENINLSYNYGLLKTFAVKLSVAQSNGQKYRVAKLVKELSEFFVKNV